MDENGDSDRDKWSDSQKNTYGNRIAATRKSGKKSCGGNTEMLTARDTMLNLIRARPNLKHIQTPNYNRGLQLGRVGMMSSSF